MALSGRTGQVGAWARSFDGEVGSDEARALAQHHLFVQHAGVGHFAPGRHGVDGEAGEAKLPQGILLEALQLSQGCVVCMGVADSFFLICVNHVRLRLYCQFGVVYELDGLVEVASLAPQLLVYRVAAQ